MSAEIAYLINLHKRRKLESALDKVLNALQPAQNVEQVEKKKHHQIQHLQKK